MNRFLVGIFFLINLSGYIQAQETFECTGELILSLTNSGQSTFYTIEVDEISGNIFFNPFTTGSSNSEINAVGYRTTDNLLYGLYPYNPVRLNRIDPAGNITFLGNLDGLNTNYGYFAGSITPDGNTFVLLGAGGSPFASREIAFVDLTDPNFSVTTMPLTTVSGQRILSTDVAFDPITGGLFGFEAESDRLIRFNLDNGQVDDTEFASVSNATSMGAVFFDAFGQMWGYGKVVSGPPAVTLFQIDTNTGLVTNKATGPSASGKDGCSCPFTIRLQKTVSPEVAFPCTEVEYTFRISNLSGIPQSGIDFIDIMPEELTVSEIVSNPFGGNITSANGSNALAIENMTLPLGINNLVVRVEIGEDALGVYNNQASLKELPEIFGEVTFSDNPNTLLAFDSTSLLVEPLEIEFLYENYSLCPGDSLTLDVTAYGLTYQWSDGSNASILTVSSEGLYSVTASTDCDQVVDEISVTENSKTLELGPDQIIELGDSVTLNIFIDGFANPIYSWEDPELNSLSCQTCPEPNARPFNDVTYTLAVDEPSGCGLVEEINITVLKNRDVFVPNVFSPNSDGLNDYFYLQAKGQVLVKMLRVYNRWGALVFENKDIPINEPLLGWNGMFKNQEVNNGVFLWTAEVEFLDGFVQQLSGDLTVLK